MSHHLIFRFCSKPSLSVFDHGKGQLAIELGSVGAYLDFTSGIGRDQYRALSIRVWAAAAQEQDRQGDRCAVHYGVVNHPCCNSAIRWASGFARRDRFVGVQQLRLRSVETAMRWLGIATAGQFINRLQRRPFHGRHTGRGRLLTTLQGTRCAPAFIR